ncbi:MAG: alpha/beta fold hydrolase [Pseudonocardiaceae bacterium]
MDGQQGGNSSMGYIRISRWLAALSGMLGAFVGIATNLYASEFRRLLENTRLGVSATTASIVVAAVVSSATTLVIYRLISRRQRQPVVFSKAVKIGAAAVADMPGVKDSVVGRSIKYLESERKSRDLVIFLHGLALDASDFRGYMAESRYHCVALTMYGFNAEEVNDSDYQPISLEAQVGLLCFALSDIISKYPKKRISIVGFSFGADMIMFLAKFTVEWLRKAQVKRAILLDPNINNSTLSISSQIAQVDLERPLKQVDSVLESASTVAEFRNLCEYLYKITGKNFAQTRRHACDVVAMWTGDDYGDFLDRLGRVISATGDVYVVLSRSYEIHFNEIVRGARARGLDVGKMETSQCDHFDLISPRNLKDLLEGIITSD